MIFEIPDKLTTWQQIGLILATPDYNDGEAYLNEGDMNEVAVLLDTYKAEREAEREAERNALHKILDDGNAIMAGSLAERISDVVADRDAACAEADKLRRAATEFANTMANLAPSWTTEMATAWVKLFAVIDK